MAVLGLLVQHGIDRGLDIADADLRTVLIGCAVKGIEQITRAHTAADNKVERIVCLHAACIDIADRMAGNLQAAAEVVDIGAPHNIVGIECADSAALDGNLCVAVQPPRIGVTAGVQLGDGAAVHRNLGAAGIVAVHRCAVECGDGAAVYRDV